MHGHILDDLTKALGHGTVSRGQTVKLAGAALASALFGGVFAPPAGARSSSRGRRGEGEDDDGDDSGHQHPGSSHSRCCPPGSFRTTAPTPQGECTCAPIAFAGGTTVPCNGRSCCICTFTIEGEGFCLDGCQPIPAGADCISSSDCGDPRAKCVVNAHGGASCLPACPPP
jgi:hypothetical protein